MNKGVDKILSIKLGSFPLKLQAFHLVIAIGLCLGILMGCGYSSAKAAQDGLSPKYSKASGQAQVPRERELPAGTVTGNLTVYQASMIFGTLPEQMPGAESDTKDMVELGRKLYFEPGMSVNKTQSCNACHLITDDGGGADTTKTSEGAKGLFGPRNAPTVLNAGYQISQFWDGRSPDLADQAKGPVLNPVEMGMSGPDVVMNRLEAKGYQEEFEKVYAGDSDPFRFENVSRSIAAFERTLRSTGAFDRFIAGNLSAMVSREKEGLQIMLDQGCARCHNGPTMGGLMYQKMGAYHPYRNQEDKGRFKVTGAAKDLYVFKVPMLRNVTLTAPYFHDGQVATLAEAVDQMGWLQLNRQLSNREIDRLLRFLTSVADEKRTSAPRPADLKIDAWWQPKNPGNLPGKKQGELIRYGYKLLSDTFHFMGEGSGDVKLISTGNRLDCANCHQNEGTKAYGIPWVGVAGRYPRYRGRSDAVKDLKDRINGCMQRSMNGQTINKESREMNAMVAYMNWLSDNTPEEIAFQGTPELEYPDRRANLEAGEQVYMQTCQACHGANGAGYQALSAGKVGSYVTPPLWGDGAYNDGAGMHRVLTAGAFIKSNMPLGTPWRNPVLTDAEAYDVAAYINSKPRPHMDGLEKDYPNLLKKRVDTPYGPYADNFPVDQHKYGPFGPIKAYYEKLDVEKVPNPNLKTGSR